MQPAPAQIHAYARPLVAAAHLGVIASLAAATGGCMGTPPEVVMVEPSYVLEHVADEDTRTLASWPVMAEHDALVDATLRQRGYVAEVAFLER
ncbi:MAG: hypothetical protein AAF328_12125 [Planctomycetota bacterium]